MSATMYSCNLFGNPDERTSLKQRKIFKLCIYSALMSGRYKTVNTFRRRVFAAEALL